MAIMVRCICGYRFSVPDEKEGENVTCPLCGATNRAVRRRDDVAPELIGSWDDVEPMVHPRKILAILILILALIAAFYLILR